MIAISDNVQLRKDVPSGTITLNRPDRRNALSREMIGLIQQALDDFMHERTVRAVIITGASDTFCSGTDLFQLQETAELPDAFKIWHDDAKAFQELIETMLRYPKPIIAAVSGWNVGSGLALMLASDLVIAGESAQLLMPEPLRGLNAGMTTPLLAFRAGTQTATRLLFSSKPVSAADARQLGLFHETVGDDFVWARAQEIAHQCAAGARESHQMSKHLLNETIGESLFTQLSIGAANMAAARTTPAAIEGVKAFLEKRDPDWEALG
jgi:enoyl-CoA hydratase/carnithine racemase